MLWLDSKESPTDEMYESLLLFSLRAIDWRPFFTSLLFESGSWVVFLFFRFTFGYSSLVSWSHCDFFEDPFGSALGVVILGDFSDFSGLDPLS